MDNISLKELQRSILSLMEQNGQITIVEISKTLNINTSSVQRNIEFLKDVEILSREGGRFGGKWIINKRINFNNRLISHHPYRPE
jgi:predicted HTH transcriptional regulator